MPLASLGSGATDATTTRVVDASDGPVPTALGAPQDPAALDALNTPSVVALLKAQGLVIEKAATALLVELRAIRELLANLR
jgi:hypothetical protein